MEDSQQERNRAHLLCAARHFCDVRWEESLVRPLAASLKLVPDAFINYRSLSLAEIGEKHAVDPDSSSYLRDASDKIGGIEVVRTTKHPFPSERPPTCMYAALLDDRACFDALRLSFFDVGKDLVEDLTDKMGVALSVAVNRFGWGSDARTTTERICEAVAHFMEFRAGRHQRIPDGFISAVWPAYLAAISDPAYYFSCVELSVVAQASRINLIVTKRCSGDDRYLIECCSQ